MPDLQKRFVATSVYCVRSIKMRLKNIIKPHWDAQLAYNTTLWSRKVVYEISLINYSRKLIYPSMNCNLFLVSKHFLYHLFQTTRGFLVVSVIITAVS
jgi:hypothetical protein